MKKSLNNSLILHFIFVLASLMLYITPVFAIGTSAPKPASITPTSTLENPYKVGSSFVKSGAIYTVKKTTVVEYTKPTSITKTSITIPTTVTVGNKKFRVASIGASAFKGNKKLTTVKIGNYVTSIGKLTFANCTRLKNVTVGSRVSTIGARAFFKCTALQTITLPATVKRIGTQAFYGDKKLTEMFFNGSTIPSVGKKAFTGIPAGGRIVVPFVSQDVRKKFEKTFRSAGLNKKALVLMIRNSRYIILTTRIIINAKPPIFRHLADICG